MPPKFNSIVDKNREQICTRYPINPVGAKSFTVLLILCPPFPSRACLQSCTQRERGPLLPSPVPVYCCSPRRRTLPSTFAGSNPCCTARRRALLHPPTVQWAGYWSNIVMPPHLTSRREFVEYFKRQFYQQYIVSVVKLHVMLVVLHSLLIRLV
jgi:hypothetical protein